MSKEINELADKLFPDKHTKKKTFMTPGNQGNQGSRLELISQSRTFKGGFGTYTVSNEVVEVTLDTSTSTFDKKTLADLVEEIVEVGGMLK